MKQALITTIALLLVNIPVCAQTKLEWKFKENERFNQETVTTLQQTLTVTGQTFRQDFEHTSQASFKVKKVLPDGSVEIEQRLEKLRATNNTGPRGTSPPGSGLVKAMEDAVFIITLGPKRDVTKFDGYDDLVKRVAGEDATASKAVRELVKPETLRSAAQEAFGFLPDKPLNKGDKWDRKVEAPLGPLGVISATHTYTYEGPEMKDGKPLHKITVTVALSYAPPKGDTGGFPFQITKGELKAQNAAGTIWFDAEAGRLVSSDMKLKLQGTLSVAIMNQAHDLVIEQEQTVTIRVTPHGQ